MKKTLFLIFSGAIVIFSIICICSAPIINKVITNTFNPLTWGYLNCKMASDNYKKSKEALTLTGDDKKKALKLLKKPLNRCNRAKAVYGLEYSSLILDVILASLCLVLGLLHYFDVGKPFEKVTGIIGLATGIIQFILTLVYICYSGYIFTNDGPESNSYPKADSKGIYASWDDSEKKYKCNYYDKDDEDAVYAKYSDLGKKIYNYDKDIYNAESTDKVKKCQYTTSFTYSYVSDCNNHDGYTSPISITKYRDCDDLYVRSSSSVENKYLYDRWVTTLIFACFIIVCDIGLAIFGFFLFKSDASGL